MDLLPVLPADRAQRADVDVHHRTPRAEGVKHGQGRLSHDASSQDQHFHAGSAAQAADEFALAAVDGQHGFQTEERPLLACGLAVGGAVAVGVLCRKRDDFLIQKRLYFLRMRRRMDTGEYDLAFPQQIIFRRFQFFYFGNQFAGFIDLLRRIHKDRAGSLIRRVAETGFCACALLDFYTVAVRRQGRHLRGRGDDTVLPVLDVF